MRRLIDRSASNQRQFSAADGETLRFIRTRRDLGFSLAKIRGLLAAAGPDQAACVSAREAARLQLVAVEARITDPCPHQG